MAVIVQRIRVHSRYSPTTVDYKPALPPPQTFAKCFPMRTHEIVEQLGISWNIRVKSIPHYFEFVQTTHPFLYGSFQLSHFFRMILKLVLYFPYIKLYGSHCTAPSRIVDTPKQVLT